MGRAPCCDKENVKRGPWSPEEDAKLKAFIHKYGTGGNWIALPHKAGLKRCGKSCRLRWLNYLRPNIKHGEFTDDEDRIICSLYANIGSRWSIIAAQLPGRTDNDIKNYWNTKLKKKLLAMLPSFQKKSSFFPSLSTPPPYRSSDHFLTTTNSSPFSGYSTTSPNYSFMNHNINTTLLVQDHINNITHLSQPPPPPTTDSNSISMMSLITNNINNNDNCLYLGFQSNESLMYNNSPMGYNYPPTSDVKESMLMFGNGDQVSATGSSSEGGSCLSQISYGDHQKIKQEDRFALEGFGNQTQSFFINHNYMTHDDDDDQKPSKVDYKPLLLHSDIEEVQLNGNNRSSSYWLNDVNDDDEYKTTHDDDDDDVNKEIRYHY